MQVGILGALEVQGEKGTVEVGGPRLRALLARLALDVGRSVPPGALVDALWGGNQPADEANALQSLVSRLRRVLPDPSVVASSPAGYRLALPDDAVDAVRFERLARIGRRQLDGGDPAAASRTLAQALDLWRGAALTDVADAPYAAAPAARLEELRLLAAEDRLEADLALGRHAEAAVALHALTAEHPLRERLRALQMRALYGAGRQAEALAVFEETRARLAGELGVDPSPELADTHLAVLRSDPSLGARLRVRPNGSSAGGDVAGGSDSRPERANLRAQLTSFVGRDDDLVAMADLLARIRLVTLVGPGGAGKTRLATEVALRHPDDAWLVELAPVTDPAAIPAATLAGLGLRESGLLENRDSIASPDAMTRLLATLRSRTGLLVLDNCEHLIEASALLVDTLLAAAPSLHILATSRESLGVTGEQLVPVLPLPVAPVAVEVPEAVDFPAVRLFVDRAQSVRPDFRLDAETVAPVVEVCRRLDGMPLAIELAAARTRSLGVDQIAARLGDRFRLLTGGSRTALPRHRTLRAVVDWSWDLLDERERTLADRLSVFAGGATVESAEAVAGEVAGDQHEVLDLLAALVDKSLLHAVGDRDVRYRMLETLREYGSERLTDSGEIEAVRRAHATYFLALAEEADTHLRSQEQLGWLRRLDAEIGNLVAAIRWAIGASDAELAVRLCAALGWYWVLRDSHAEAAALLSEALALPGEMPPETAAVARSMYALHAMASHEDFAGAAAAFEHARELATGVPSTNPIVLLLEPAAAVILGDHDRALELAASTLIGVEDVWTRATFLLLCGVTAENVGDVDGGRANFQESLDLYRTVGDRWGRSNAIQGLGRLLMLHGEHAEVLALQAEALALARELDSPVEEGNILVQTASTRLRIGDTDGARADLDAARLAYGPHPLVASTVFMGVGAGWVELTDGRPDRAKPALEEALAVTERVAVGPPQVLAILHIGLGFVAETEGDLGEARAQHLLGVQAALRASDMPVVAAAVEGLASTAMAAGDTTRAAELLGSTMAIRGALDEGAWLVRRVRDAAVAALGQAAYDEAFARGAALAQKEAIDRAQGT